MSRSNGPLRNRAPPDWDKPDLHEESHVKQHPLYQLRDDELRALKPPTDYSSYLPVQDPADPSRILVPKEEVIFVAIDFENLCKVRIMTKDDGTTYRYKPLTEAGLAYLDTREVMIKFHTREIMAKNGKGLALTLSDRGIGIFPIMKKIHFVVEEFKTHWGDNCRESWEETTPYAFGFGQIQIHC